MTSEQDIGSVSRVALTRLPTPITLQTLLAGMLLIALYVANVSSLRAFVVVAVGVVALWVWDIIDNATDHGIAISPYPPLVAVAASAWGAFRFGFGGFAAGTAIGVAFTLSLGIFDETFRAIRPIAHSVLASLLAGLAAGGLVLLRLRWNLEVIAFLVVMVVALVAATVARQLQEQYPLFDANIAALAGGALAGLVVGLLSSLSVGSVFVAAVAAAGGLVAGTTAGSLLRWRQISLLTPAPGALTMLDGPLFAAAVFWLALVTLTG